MISRARDLLHLLVANIAYYSGLLRLWFWFRGSVWRKREICILGLHRVLTNEQRSRSASLPAMVLTSEVFSALLDYLKENFQLISVNQFLNGLAANKTTSKPACMITFDDGWGDNYNNAFPLLKARDIPATIFLATGYIDAKETFWVEQVLFACRDKERRKQVTSRVAALLSRNGCDDLHSMIESLKRVHSQQRQQILDQTLLPNEKTGSPTDGFLTWQQVREMDRHGIHFGTHTVTHPLLTYEDSATVESELKESQRQLERQLNKTPVAFAYPNGECDSRVSAFVQQAGYKCAFTTQRGWYGLGGDRFTIRRILLHDGNVAGADGKFSPAMLNFALTGWR